MLLPSPTVKQESKAVEENVGLIVYNGAMVDVGSLLQKLEKSERVRAEIEQKLQLLEEKTGVTLLWRWYLHECKIWIFLVDQLICDLDFLDLCILLTLIFSEFQVLCTCTPVIAEVQFVAMLCHKALKCS